MTTTEFRVMPNTEAFERDVVFLGTSLLTVAEFAWYRGRAYIENDAGEWVTTEVTPVMQALIDAHVAQGAMRAYLQHNAEALCGKIGDEMRDGMTWDTALIGAGVDALLGRDSDDAVFESVQAQVSKLVTITTQVTIRIGAQAHTFEFVL